MQANVPLSSVVGAKLRAVRRRRRWVAVVTSLACTALGLALFLIAAILMGSEPNRVTPLAQSLARLWMLSVVFCPLLIWVVPTWLRTARLLHVARAVDARLPQLHGSLETAVDLAYSLAQPGNHWSPGTRALALRQLAESEDQARAVSPKDLLPLSEAGRVALFGPLALAAALMVVSTSSVPLAGTFAALFGPVDGAHDDPKSVESAPKADLALRNITIRLQPPRYSGREAVLLEATSGDFRALPGTQVELRADLNSQGTAVELQWLGETLARTATEGSTMSLVFTVPGGGWYQLALQRGGGRARLTSRRFRVEGLPDNPPQLEVQGPSDIELRPDETLQLALRVSDDFALSRLERVVLRGGREVLRGSLVEVAGLDEWSGDVSWAPGADLGGRGGKVQLVIEAFDNDTVNGPKVTRSRPLRIHVPTERDQHEQVLRLKQILLETGIDLLAPMLLSTSVEDELDQAALLADLDSQRSLAMAFFEVAGKLATAASNDRYEKQSVFLGIGQLVENFARRFRRYEEYVEAEIRHQKDSYVYASIREDLLRVRAAAVTELEQALLELSAFVELQRGQDAYEKVLGAEEALASLSELLRAGAQGKPVAEELASALAELSEQLQELSRALAERGRGPDDSFQNSLPQDLGKDLMRAIAELIEEGRYDEALERLRQAMEVAAELRQALQEEQQMAAGQPGERLQRQLQETLAQAVALEERQERLLDSTRKLQRRHGDGDPMSERERGELAAAVELLLERIEDLPPDGLPPRTVGAIRQRARLAHGMVQELREAWLRQGDIERAVERGEVAGAYIESMKDDLTFLPAELQQRREFANSRIQQASDLASDIVAQLQQGMRRASSQRAEAGSSGEAARRKQDRLRGDVGRLRSRLEDRSGLGGGAYNPSSARDNLESAGQFMGGASSDLARGRLGQAVRSEESALEQLRSFRQTLEESQRAMQAKGAMGSGRVAGAGGQGAGQGDPWGRVEAWNGDGSGGEVDLPDPADFVSPEAFRSLVQEGAQGDAPERYRPLNSNYYEELLR